MSPPATNGRAALAGGRPENESASRVILPCDFVNHPIAEPELGPRIHSIDLEPCRDGRSHHLLINGKIAARFNTLSQALQARAELTQTSLKDQSNRRGAGLSTYGPTEPKGDCHKH
jgi:hypothetical protein